MDGPGGVFCVASARRADADATIAGLSAAGFARSRFRPLPTPAVPVTALDKAVRAGSAAGLPTPRVDWAIAGLSTFVGEAETADFSEVREGVVAGAASGLILGSVLELARCVVICAICVAVLADWVLSARWLRSALGFDVFWRATVADDGRGCSLEACAVACVRETSADRVAEAGSADADTRRDGEETVD
jgi:hypothetical protein